MIDKQEHIFSYNHILRDHSGKPGFIATPWQPRPKNCRDCKVEFTATSPLQKRCPTCQAVVKARGQHRNNLKSRAKRKAARQAAA